jgi:hypothetical protein
MPVSGTLYGTPAMLADYARVSFPSGNWRMTVKIDRAGAEYGMVNMSAYTSANGFTYQTLDSDIEPYIIDFDGSGWVNLSPGSGGYASWIISASFCQRRPTTPSGGTIVIANGELGRVLNTTSYPKPARPFFGPADWQPDTTVGFVDVVTAVATDIQNIAEALANELDPTDDFIATFREIGQFGNVVQTAVWTATWADVLSGDTFGQTFANSLSYGSKIQLSVDAAGGLSSTQKALLAGVALNLRVEP